MFELYLDTADPVQIARFNACLPLRGITTNPTILAKTGSGVNEVLAKTAAILGKNARFHVQVVSNRADEMLQEAAELSKLPYDIVIKVPATETGLTAIKCMKAKGFPVLATAIYSVQQGFLAALCGADYLAPYVNRIDAFGANGVQVVADLQQLLDCRKIPCKLLPASFKNTRQVLESLQAGVTSLTLSPEVAAELLIHPSVSPAVERFADDWRAVFGKTLSYES